MTLSSVSAQPGGVATLNLSLVSGMAVQPAALQWTLNYPASSIKSINVTPGPALTAAGKSLSCSSRPEGYICVASAINANTIPDGVVGSVALSLSETTSNFSVGVNGALGASLAATAISISVANGNITVGAPTPGVSTVISSLTCSSSTLTPASSTICTVGLSAAAGSAGAVVQLASSGGVSIPASVTVPAATSSVAFTASAGLFSSDQTATITASLSGSSQTASLAMATATVVSSLQCSPATLAANTSATCSVALSKAAPSGGVSLALASATSALVVPAAVTVPANATSAVFQASTGAVKVAENATVTASLNGSSKSSTIALSPSTTITSLQCSQTTLSGANQAAICTVTVANPSGVISVAVSSDNPALNIPAPVVVLPGGASSGKFTVVSAPSSSDQTAEITASLNGSSQRVSITVLAVATVSSLQCGATKLAANANTTCTVTLSKSAPNGGSVVAIATPSSALTIPASITVPANTVSATFQAATTALTAPENASVTASLNASSKAFTISLVPTPTVTSLQCSPASLTGSNQSALCTVTVAHPSGVTNISISSDNPGLTLASSTVALPEGVTSGTFTVLSGSFTSDRTAKVTASLNGGSQTASISLVVPTLVSSVQCDATSLGPNSKTTCTVTLSRAAVAGGASVSLSSSTSAMSLPPAITVPAGSTSATFQASTAALTGTVSVVVTAALSESSKSFAISLVGLPSITSLQCSPASLIGSNRIAICTVTVANPNGVVAISISSDNPALSAPPTVVLPSGMTSARFNAVSGNFASDQTARLTAALNGTTQSASISLVTPTVVSSLQCGAAALAGNTSTTCAITISKPAPLGGAAVQLSSSVPALVVPPTVSVSANATSASFAASTLTLPSAQPATISASLNGGAATASLALSPTAMSVSSLTCLTTTFTGPNQASVCTANISNPSGMVMVSVSSDNPALVVPAPTAVLPARSSSAKFTVFSGSFGAPQTATLKASLNGSWKTATFSLVPSASNVSMLSDNARDLHTAAASCQPKILQAGETSECEIRLRAAAEKTVELAIVSSSQNLKTPTVISLRPGQRRARFEIAADPESAQETVTVAAVMGEAAIETTVGLSTSGGHSTIQRAIDAVETAPSVPTDPEGRLPQDLRLQNAGGASALDACTPRSVASLVGRFLAINGKTRVLINGEDAVVLDASPQKVDFLCPAGVPGTVLSIEVETETGVSQPIRSAIVDLAPGILTVRRSSRNQALAFIDGSFQLSAIPNSEAGGEPARPGDTLTILATGIGVAGGPPQTAVVQFGSAVAVVAVIEPEYDGISRLRMTVPTGISGARVSLTIRMIRADGSPVQSNTAFIAVEE